MTAQAVAAVVPVLLAAAGAAAAQSAPRPLEILDVPFISQSEALCGGAAAAMILRYWGARELTAESFAYLVDHSAAGIRTDVLVGDLRRRGWTALAVEGSDDLVRQELARGRPVLALIEDRPRTFHYVVVVASTPGAFVFHDPARSPFRVMNREAFGRRWAAAGHWMAVVVPASLPEEPPAPSAVVPSDAPCDALIAEGVRRAQANDLEEAERRLTAALSCGGAAPLRELAGLRLLQRRWNEVAELAGEAVSQDPGDTHAWDLLATSRFVQDDLDGALDAWNRIDRPRVDLVAVRGLTRTRQDVVERLLAVPQGDVLTRERFVLTARRLGELPSVSSSRLELVPSAAGLGELRAHVVERPVLPSDRWSYVMMGAVAAARSEVGLSTGAFAGGGERLSGSWRFWPDRPRLHAELTAPAPWGGLWSVDAFHERQPFTGDDIRPTQRTGAGLQVSRWASSWTRVAVRGRIEEWDGRGAYGAVTGRLEIASPADRVEARVEGSGWAGGDRFASVSTEAVVRSNVAHQGRVFVLRAGAAATTAHTPPDLWFGGDTGRTRPVPLRAHPVTTGGRFRVDRIGRRLFFTSVEARQWWRPGPIGAGIAAFVDGAHVGERLAAGGVGDVDAGVGARVSVPGVAGLFRVDLAKGLRDGATSLSFVYEP